MYICYGPVPPYETTHMFIFEYTRYMRKERKKEENNKFRNGGHFVRKRGTLVFVERYPSRV